MNVVTGSEPKNIVRGFKGLWDRGSFENVPVDHLSLADNCIFPGQDLVGIREGLNSLSDAGTLGGGEFVISAFPYSIIVPGTNVTDFIFLTSSGRIIDGASNTALGTFTGGANPPDDMSCINLYGRVFISLKAVGIAWENSNAKQSSVHYYDGTLFLPIAGDAPASAPTLTQPNPGVVDIGDHIVAYSYLYKYGYISPPSPTATITSTGSNDILVSGLPGSYPAGVIAVVIQITQANGETLYFMPLAGNVTATTFDYNDSDTSLIASADYLNDILPTVPNGASLKVYHGRMSVIGGHGVENIQLFSDQLIPESFNQLTDIVTLPLDFAASDPNTAVIINDSFYILKPNGTYVTQDNLGTPSTWPLTAVDAAFGGWDTGVSNFGSSYVDILDSALVCSPRGLVLFTGSYQDTPLSFNIEHTWRSINPKAFYLVQIAHDVWAKRVYIAAPLFNNTVNNFVLMMDYSEGLSPQSVKWSKWYFAAHGIITKLAQMSYLITGSGAQNIANQPVFAFGDSNKIITLLATNNLDEGTNGIQQIVRTAGLMLDKAGAVNMFLMIRLCIQFSQNLILQAYNSDGSLNYSFTGFFQNFAPVTNYTDLVIGTPNTHVTSAAHPFGAINVGNYLYIRSGTGFTIQRVLINSVSGTTAICSAPLGTIGSTAGVGLSTPYYAGQELDRLINVTTEKLIIGISNDTTGTMSWFLLNRIDLFGNAMFTMRPALSQSM